MINFDRDIIQNNDIKYDHERNTYHIHCNGMYLNVLSNAVEVLKTEDFVLLRMKNVLVTLYSVGAPHIVVIE